MIYIYLYIYILVVIIPLLSRGLCWKGVGGLNIEFQLLTQTLLASTLSYKRTKFYVQNHANMC